MIKPPPGREFALLANEANRELRALHTSPFMLASYTVATVPPAASWADCAIIVSDESGGPTLAFSDGTDWLRTSDNAPIS